MNAPLPGGRFGAILADPPWSFVAWSPKGQGRSGNPRAHRAAGRRAIPGIMRPPLTSRLDDVGR